MGKRRRNFGVFVPVGLSVSMRSSSSCTFRLKSIVCAQRSHPCSLTSDTKPGGRSSACPGETAVSRLPRRHHRIATDGFWTSRVFCFVLWVVSLKKNCFHVSFSHALPQETCKAMPLLCPESNFSLHFAVYGGSNSNKKMGARLRVLCTDVNDSL